MYSREKRCDFPRVVARPFLACSISHHKTQNSVINFCSCFYSLQCLINIEQNALEMSDALFLKKNYLREFAVIN